MERAATDTCGHSQTKDYPEGNAREFTYTQNKRNRPECIESHIARGRRERRRIREIQILKIGTVDSKKDVSEIGQQFICPCSLILPQGFGRFHEERRKDGREEANLCSQLVQKLRKIKGYLRTNTSRASRPARHRSTLGSITSLADCNSGSHAAELLAGSGVIG